ncbi:MAG: ribosome small subunit-dependent GTPase A [Anaerolineales bacterium]|nr:ribosome small subunit-dependent GTPase A [Anaerolineales bacterium]
MKTDLKSTRAPGVVCRREYSAFLVLWEGRIISCGLASGCAYQPVPKNSSHPKGRPAGESRRAACAAPEPVVGDRVWVEQTDSESGWIREILPRRTQISRRAAAGPGGQVLAANVDQVLAFCVSGAARPEWHLLDRMLALAELEGVPAVIILSKADLIPEIRPHRDDLEGVVSEYLRIGYPVVACSARTGLGLAEVQSLLREKTTLLLGKSGVGKSSLLNALFPDWRLRVAETTRFGEGRCATSNAELHPTGSGAIVDMPGFRKLAPWGTEDLNPAAGFREMQPFIGACRFGMDCRHTEEPGCEIRRAVEAGRVGARRFRSMLRLAEDRP